MENFEVGKEVQVITDKGTVRGFITEYWGSTQNQFMVKFLYDGYMACNLTFSKKTGKLYGRCNPNYRNKFIKVQEL